MEEFRANNHPQNPTVGYRTIWYTTHDLNITNGVFIEEEDILKKAQTYLKAQGMLLFHGQDMSGYDFAKYNSELYQCDNLCAIFSQRINKEKPFGYQVEAPQMILNVNANDKKMIEGFANKLDLPLEKRL